MAGLLSDPPRLTTKSDSKGVVPVQVVWELTLACNLSCAHCGSRAGSKRKNELSTSEVFSVVDELVALGTRELNIIGGEVYLRKDWLDIISYVASKGLLCSMQTGAYGLSDKMINAAAEAGLNGIGVSIDGLENAHDQLRGRIGSFSSALRSLEAAQKIGLTSSVNTQISTRSKDDLEKIYELIRGLGASYWQVQLTVAMGNAADNNSIIVEPFDLLLLYPRLAEIYRQGAREGLILVPGNNIGYFGPFKSLWRGPEAGGHYSGCPAGRNALGIEADGTIKACPSLNKRKYGGGNVREASLAKIWQDGEGLKFNRDGRSRVLSGYCAECYYRDTCRGGCTWTSDSLLGAPGNNPYCHHRALRLAGKGRRERVRKLTEANREPFGVGLFEVIEEEAPKLWLAAVRQAYSEINVPELYLE